MGYWGFLTPKKPNQSKTNRKPHQKNPYKQTNKINKTKQNPEAKQPTIKTYKIKKKNHKERISTQGKMIVQDKLFPCRSMLMHEPVVS